MAAGGDAYVQWNSTVGTGSYVLLFCTGAAEQVANATKSQHAVALGQLTSVVGSVRNLKMYIASASASATLTADEIVVETALGGLKYQLSSLSKTINLAATGAGGMDTGSAPTSGYVAIYAIYNPTTGASALLAYNSTSVVASNVYPGSNMPSGYTASALISVWPTNSSGQFVSGIQNDRKINLVRTTALSATTAQGSLTSLSLASIIPPNAKTVSGDFQVSSTSSSTTTLSEIASNSSGLAALFAGAGIANSQGQYDIPIAIQQTIYYSGTVTSGSIAIYIYVNGYTIQVNDMPKVNVQFSNEKETDVIAYFAGPQDQSIYQNQTEIDSSDSRYIVFYNSLPQSVQ